MLARAAVRAGPTSPGLTRQLPFLEASESGRFPHPVMVNFLVFCTAAAQQVPFPGWLASITQLPAFRQLIVAGDVDERPEIEHTVLDDDATLNVTGGP